jgi:SynChlorMet cassette radical SAM/SPASM protein ScmE
MKKFIVILFFLFPIFLFAQDSTIVWFKFFDEIKEYSIKTLIISGGEPLLRKDIKEIIDRVVSNGIQYKILSNGTLITDELASFLKSSCKCKGVQVSLDGSMAITHDAFRGEGSFERAKEGILTLQRHGVPVSVRMTIHKKNVEELEEISRLLLEELNLPNFSTCSASYMGLCRKNAENLMLSAKERSIAMENHLKLEEKYGNRIIGDAGPLADARCWVEIREAQETGVQNFPGGGFLSACDGVSSKISVRSDGMYTPCVLLSHIELGRINDVKLKDFWLNHPELNRLRDRKNVRLSTFEYCKDCDYINYCTGSCPAMSYNVHGEDYTPSPDTCFKRFVLDGGKIPVKLKSEKIQKKETPEWVEALNQIFQG